MSGNETGALEWLERANLLRGEGGWSELTSLPLTLQLLRLCDRGRLKGGLSVALDLQPDELFGPLTQAMGGTAAKLKLNDVRKGDVTELWVEDERWEVPSLESLIAQLNDRVAGEQAAARVAVLGEHQEMIQLWALPLPKLRALLHRPDFVPVNLAKLKRLAKS